MAREAKETATDFINKVVEVIKELPGKIWEFLQEAITKVSKFGSDAALKAKTAATDIFNAISEGLMGLPGEMASIGSDIVRGLWNGINDMVGWITDKLSSFGGDILQGIKDFFDIESPSKVFKNEVGKMLSIGLAEGIEDNASRPLDAMADLSNGILGEAGELNGLTLERRLQHTFASPVDAATAETGMLDKLDRILEAIKQGQLITLDGDKLVGGTVNRTDAALGQRRVLAARGAV
jgi:phage-related protein